MIRPFFSNGDHPSYVGNLDAVGLFIFPAQIEHDMLEIQMLHRGLCSQMGLERLCNPIPKCE